MGVIRAPADTHPGYIAGKWYFPPVYGTVGAGAALVSGSVRAVPFYLTKPITISDLGARITTASAGNNIRLAIYRGDPTTGKPTGTAVVETGNISTTSTGTVSAAVTAQATLGPGFYFMAVNADNAVVVLQVIATASNHQGALVGSATLANVNWNAGGAYIIYTFASAFGTFPDLTGQTLVEVSANTCGLVMMKAA